MDKPNWTDMLAHLDPTTRAAAEATAARAGMSVEAFVQQAFEKHVADLVTLEVATGIAKGELEVVDKDTVRWVRPEGA